MSRKSKRYRAGSEALFLYLGQLLLLGKWPLGFVVYCRVRPPWSRTKQAWPSVPVPCLQLDNTEYTELARDNITKTATCDST